MTPPNESSDRLVVQAAQPTPNNNDAALQRSRQSPLSWKELQSIILSSDLVKLARSPEQQRIYRKGRADIHDNWESIYDYLLCVKFGFEESIAEVSGKKRSRPTFEELQSQWRSGPPSNTQTAMKSRRMVLCLNDYPYYLESGIEHWILWKLGGHVEDEEIERAKLRIVCQCAGVVCDDDGIEMQFLDSFSSGTAPRGECHLNALVHDDSIFLHWVNPPHLKRQVALFEVLLTMPFRIKSLTISVR
ncbi:hypothetical protein HJC23_003341 [Cyclotella cryptica]|uniref:Uncharacterized protein n=1 Tax=Cyclotella cryptica TaxID=29204 RepID=A0ABD3QXE0_9STRA|eukprot:CCRYP_000906-RA/>CCRYP_000906-RA protein AED:0.34 eAED:0.34 QI:0/-1/0/1/-1/1/1/0/245